MKIVAEPNLFTFGPTVNLPALNEPLGDIIRPVRVKIAAQTLSSSRICRIKPSSSLMMGTVAN